MRLIAKCRILHGNYQYERGDALPTRDAAYCRDLVAAGSAAWEDEEAPKPFRKKAPEAIPLTAPAGVAGLATPAAGCEPDLVGRVPSPKAQGAVKQKGRRASKSKA